MDLPEDARRIAAANRIFRWAGRATVALMGLALGASVGSGLVWDQPEKLPDRARIAHIAALVYPVPPEWIGGEDGPATVPAEDWPLEPWQQFLFGSAGQDGSAGASWPDTEIPANDDVAYQRLVDAEAALRADGWIIDGYADSLRRNDGTPTPDDVLIAHKDQTEITVSSDGYNSPSLDVYPLSYPTPAIPVLGGALAGLALAMTWMFARQGLLRRKGMRGGMGVAGAALLVPSAVVALIAAASEGAWGESAANLWSAARFFVPVMPLGLLLNIGFALLLTELIRFVIAKKPEPVLAA